jgi:DNA-directed RNA polymerase subunit N (RpoN/RPB10)
LGANVALTIFCAPRQVLIAHGVDLRQKAKIRVPKIGHSVRGQLWHRLAEIGVENQNIFQRLSIKAQCCRRRRSRVQRGKAAGEADIQRSIFFA